MSSSTKSKLVLFVSNVSGSTPTRDVRHEFERSGPVRDIEIDRERRTGLVEMKREDDARHAFKWVHNTRMDHRSWAVDYATREDFRRFGWKWFETSSRESSPPRGVSRSPSPPPRSSRGGSPGGYGGGPGGGGGGGGRSRSRSPPARQPASAPASAPKPAEEENHRHHDADRDRDERDSR